MEGSLRGQTGQGVTHRVGNRALLRAKQEKDHPVTIQMLLQHVRTSVSRWGVRNSCHPFPLQTEFQTGSSNNN